MLAWPRGWPAFRVSPSLPLTPGFFLVSSSPQCSFVVSKAFSCPGNLAPPSTYLLSPPPANPPACVEALTGKWRGAAEGVGEPEALGGCLETLSPSGCPPRAGPILSALVSAPGRTDVDLRTSLKPGGGRGGAACGRWRGPQLGFPHSTSLPTPQPWAPPQGLGL